MKVFPFASFNKPNAPMGLIDHALPVDNYASTRLQMKELVRRADQEKQPITELLYRTRKTKHPSDSGFMYMEVQKPENEDYLLKCKVTVSPPEPTDSDGSKS